MLRSRQHQLPPDSTYQGEGRGSGDTIPSFPSLGKVPYILSYHTSERASANIEKTTRMLTEVVRTVQSQSEMATRLSRLVKNLRVSL